jgi:hypothetical protein
MHGNKAMHANSHFAVATLRRDMEIPSVSNPFPCYRCRTARPGEHISPESSGGGERRPLHDPKTLHATRQKPNAP